jgi:hypothetical protein
MPSYSGVWTMPAVYQAVGSNNWTNPLFAVGAQANLIARQLQRGSMAFLETDKFLYSYIEYNTGTGDADLKAVVGTISGSTITFGTAVTIRAGLSPQGVGCCALSPTVALVTYGNASSQWEGRPLSISGTTITMGTAVSTGDTAGAGAQCSALTSTTAISTTSYGSLARIATISSNSLTWGSSTTIGSGTNNNYATLSSGSSTTAIISSRPSSGANVGKQIAVACTISGTTITAGSETVIDATGMANEPTGICSVSATSAILVGESATGNYFRGIGLSISGTTITAGTPVTFNSIATRTGNYDSGPVIARLSGTQALYTAQQGTSLVGLAVTINGTTVTSSAPSTIYSSAGGARPPSVAFLGGKAVVGYGDSTTNIAAKVLTL